MMAIAAAAVLLLGSELVIQPLASHFWPSPENVSSALKIPVHDWKVGLRSLAIVWIFAGFGEEIGYRGYLLTRAADLGNRSKIAYIVAMLYVAVLFGFGHVYKGPAGIMDSTYSGLGTRRRLPSLRPQFMGPDPGTRNNRYCRRRGDIYGLGNVGTQRGSTPIRIGIPYFAVAELKIRE